MSIFKSNKIYNLKSSFFFKTIKALIFKELFNKINLSSQKVDYLLSKSKNCDLRNNNKLMLKIEENILSILENSLGKSKFCKIKSLQYPVNIRIVSNKNNEYKLKKFDTRHIHCDSWSGAPKDSYNGLIYIHCSNKSPRLEIYKTLPLRHPLRKFLGEYSSVDIEKEHLKKIDFKPRIANMILWETNTPHKTFIPNSNSPNKNYFRISLDFRFKCSSPYFSYKNNSFFKNFYKFKMNSEGVYWSLRKKIKSFENIKEKIEYELSKSKTFGKKFYTLRKKYLQLHYKESY
jgi:hypothetical protein